jgi:hypothetical protein
MGVEASAFETGLTDRDRLAAHGDPGQRPSSKTMHTGLPVRATSPAEASLPVIGSIARATMRLPRSLAHLVKHFKEGIRGIAVAALTLVATSALAQGELKIMAPAGPAADGTRPRALHPADPDRDGPRQKRAGDQRHRRGRHRRPRAIRQRRQGRPETS